MTLNNNLFKYLETLAVTKVYIKKDQRGMRGILTLPFISKNIASVVLIALVFIDLIGVDLRYLDSSKYVDKEEFSTVFTPSKADEQILQDKSYYRVFNSGGDPYQLSEQTARTSYYHNIVSRYLIDFATVSRTGSILIDGSISLSSFSSQSAAGRSSSIISAFIDRFYNIIHFFKYFFFCGEFKGWLENTRVKRCIRPAQIS